MAQRKCGICSEPGHTRRTCTAAETPAMVSVTRQDPSWQETGRPEEEPVHTYATPAEDDLFEDPTPATRSYGPVHASFTSECAECDGAIFEGDLIHPDGSGGWNCDQCHRILAEVANGHVHRFTWADDGNGHEGSYCQCGAMDTGAEKLARHRAATLPCPPGVHSMFDPCPGNCTQPYPVEDGATDAGDEDQPVFADPALEFLLEDPTPATPKREETNQRGYLAKDPTIGDFRRYKNGNIKPITRVSTFIKAASNRTALTDWNMRNVLLGLAHSPDVIPQVLALHPHPEGPLPEDKDTKGSLDSLVDIVSERVGSKRAAQRGTDVHSSIDRVARGLVTLDGIPSDHVPWVEAFLKCLDDNGLELIPSLVERTIYVPQFGGVMGRFDQAVRRKATGSVHMTDNKTGRIDYAWQEIEGQLALYVAGYTQHGTYAWHPTDPAQDAWEPPQYALDADLGFVFHLPVKSGVPSCTIYEVDLRRGWKHVQVCADVRGHLSGAPKPVAWTETVEPPAAECAWIPGQSSPSCDWSRDCPDHGQLPAEPEDRDWVSEFAQARDKTHLAGLYESAASVLGPGEKLDYLVATGQARLRALAALETARAVLGEASDEPPF